MSDGIADFEALDWKAFRDFFDGFRPSGLPAASTTTDGKGGIGWRGIFRETEFISPPPVPSGRPTTPTMYGRFSFDHQRTSATLEGRDAPARWGVLSTAIRLELGADDVWVRGPGGVFQQLRQRMRDVSTTSFALFPEGKTERHGQDGNFIVFVLRTNFTIC